MQEPKIKVPHSQGTNIPHWVLPAFVCDSHMHIFDPKFKPSAHWARIPPIATVQNYQSLQKRLGTSRTIVVTPSTYGTDNSCTLDAIKKMGTSARGIAVVAQNVSKVELNSLAAQNICGLRVNFVSPQPWGDTTPEMLSTLAHKIARLGWHIQIFVESPQLIALAPLLRKLPVPLVIDHMALISPKEGIQGDAYYVLRDLVEAGNTWVKLSGAYMRSTAGEPAYSDTFPLVQGLIHAIPERLVWGSDWPHTTQPFESVNDVSLINLLGQCCNMNSDILQRILVINPSLLYGFPESMPVNTLSQYMENAS